MYICLDCKSNNIVQSDDYYCYFREGDYVRLRTIVVYKNMNPDDTLHGYFAMCPALSMTAVTLEENPLLAITKLGKMLDSMYHVQLIGKEIVECSSGLSFL